MPEYFEIHPAFGIAVLAGRSASFVFHLWLTRCLAPHIYNNMVRKDSSLFFVVHKSKPEWLGLTYSIFVTNESFLRLLSTGPSIWSLFLSEFWKNKIHLYLRRAVPPSASINRFRSSSSCFGDGNPVFADPGDGEGPPVCR